MKKSTFTRLFSIALALVMAVCCFAGCGSTDADTKAPASDDAAAGVSYAKDANTVVVATVEEPANISAYNHSTLAGAYFNRLTFNGLMCFDHDLNPVCDLAESYEVKEDENGELTQWYFYLRQGVKFHDGSELHAEDVVASLLTAKATPECSMFTKGYVDVQEVDEYTVLIISDGVTSSLLTDLCVHFNYICPKALLESGHDFNSHPIGTGPYKFVDWTLSESLTFVKFEDYFKTDNAARIENVIFKIMPESSTRTIALESHEVDYVIDFDTNEVERVSAADNEIGILTRASTGHHYLVFNTEVEPFGDVNLRKAINCCINKDDVITVALNGAGSVALSVTPDNMIGHTTANTEVYSMDKAQEYLKAWGGDPSTLSFEIIVKTEVHKRAAEVVQENLRQLGIACTVQSYDSATYGSMVASGNYTAAISSWTTETVMSYLNGNFRSSSIGATNRARWNDAYSDELIAKVCSTIDETERAGYAEEVIEHLNANQVTIPLYQNNIVSAANEHLKGTDLQAAGNLYVEEWYWD